MKTILYRWLTAYLSYIGAIVWFDLGGGDSTTVVSDPGVAQASEKAAQLSKELGEAQIAESKRQYDTNLATIQPIVDAQKTIMDQTAEQGKDYYDYNVETFRPLEKSMVEQARAEADPQRQEEEASKAIADTRVGQTQAANTVFRQGMRYGFNKDAIAAIAGSMAGANASAVSGAATGARDKQKNLGWAREMDVAGLARGLPGASTGAYGVAVSAGNSAAGNQMAPGQALLGGMAQGANMQIAGQGQALQGLSGLYGAQINQANSINQANAAGSAGLGSLLGTVGGIAAKAYFSSKQVKHDKKPIDDQEVLAAIDDTPVEKWTYNKGVSDEGDHVGPYAEDVHKNFGEAAAPGGKSIDPITMNGIALSGIRALSERVKRLESGYGIRRAA